MMCLYFRSCFLIYPDIELVVGVHCYPILAWCLCTDPLSNPWQVCISLSGTQWGASLAPLQHILLQSHQLQVCMWWVAIHVSTVPECCCTRNSCGRQAVSGWVCLQVFQPVGDPKLRALGVSILGHCVHALSSWCCCLIKSGNLPAAFACIQNYPARRQDKFFDVKAHLLCVASAEETVPQELWHGEIRCAWWYVTFVLNEVTPSHNVDKMWIFFLGAIVHDNFAKVNFCFPTYTFLILLWFMTNIKLVPFWLVFLILPCTIPPKSFPNAVFQTSAIAGLGINCL